MVKFNPTSFTGPLVMHKAKHAHNGTHPERLITNRALCTGSSCTSFYSEHLYIEETGKQFILLVRSSTKYLFPKLTKRTCVYKGYELENSPLESRDKLLFLIQRRC